MNSSTIRINGETRAELAVSDRAIHFGDGLFETIRVTQGEGEFLGRHLARRCWRAPSGIHHE
ncbi:MAG: hypothetical protein PVI91_15615 [Gammaproteobacteria bacterium]